MKTIVRAAFAASLLYTAAGTAALLAPTAAYAEDRITPNVSKPLSEAIKAAHANDFQTALARVKEAQAVADRTPFDDYKINSILAFIAINIKDNDTATAASEAAADLPAVPDAEKKSTFYNALLFAAQAKHYQKAITYGQQLAALNGLDATTEAVLAQVYYFTQDYPHAQQYAQMSIDASKAVGTPPNGTALDIVMNSQTKQNNPAGDQEMLENLAVNFNKGDSWRPARRHRAFDQRHRRSRCALSVPIENAGARCHARRRLYPVGKCRQSAGLSDRGLCRPAERHRQRQAYDG